MKFYGFCGYLLKFKKMKSLFGASCSLLTKLLLLVALFFTINPSEFAGLGTSADSIFDELITNKMLTN